MLEALETLLFARLEAFDGALEELDDTLKAFDVALEVSDERLELLGSRVVAAAVA